MTSLTSPGFLVSAIATVPNVWPAVQLQGIWNSELSSKLSERVLDPAQSNVTRCRLLGRKNPAFRLPRLLKLNVPEQSDDALAQRHKPASFACLALGVEIKRALKGLKTPSLAPRAPPSRLKPEWEAKKVVVFLRERKQGAGHHTYRCQRH
jgi:hypothetical protein